MRSFEVGRITFGDIIDRRWGIDTEDTQTPKLLQSDSEITPICLNWHYDIAVKDEKRIQVQLPSLTYKFHVAIFHHQPSHWRSRWRFANGDHNRPSKGFSFNLNKSTWPPSFISRRSYGYKSSKISKSRTWHGCTKLLRTHPHGPSSPA